MALANTVDEVLAIKNKAEALRAYAMQAKDVEMMNWAAEIKVRAERKAGKLLKKRDMHKGGRPSENPSHDASSLADIGINHSESSRYQQTADVPEKTSQSARVSSLGLNYSEVSRYQPVHQQSIKRAIYKVGKLGVLPSTPIFAFVDFS